MSFWKSLFGKKEKNKISDKTYKQADKFRSEHNELELKKTKELEELVKPLIRNATRISLSAASSPPKNSQLNSHFGGQPYFEENELWPVTKSGKHLDFIFQIFNIPEIELPNEIKLIQFYYNWDEFPWDSKDDGWHVKLYNTLNKEKMVCLHKPEGAGQSKYCEMTFESTFSLPDWEGIDIYNRKVSNISCALDEEVPWDKYDQIVNKLIGEQDFQSQLGGYPKWVQGESTPRDHEGNPMKILFQIDSEEKAGFMWGDLGLVYVFHNAKDDKLEFTLQCH